MAVNPLRRSLRYEIGRSANVTLRIFDVRGAMVRELVDAYQAPGDYEVIWDGRNVGGSRVASGSYYYRLLADDVEASGKLLMVR